MIYIFMNMISDTIYYKLLSFWKYFILPGVFTIIFYGILFDSWKKTMRHDWWVRTLHQIRVTVLQYYSRFKRASVVFLKMCVSGRIHSFVCGSQSNRSRPWFQHSVDLNAEVRAPSLLYRRLSDESLLYQVIVLTGFNARSNANCSLENRYKDNLTQINYTVE